MKSFWEVKGFWKKIRGIKTANQAFQEKEKPIWKNEASFWEEENAI